MRDTGGRTDIPVRLGFGRGDGLGALRDVCEIKVAEADSDCDTDCDSDTDTDADTDTDTDSDKISTKTKDTDMIMKLITLLCLVTSFSAMAADIPAEPLVRKGDPVLSDDFERAGLGDWKVVIPTFSVTNGVLKGVQTRADHGSVGRVYRKMKDVVVEFKFKFEGGKSFNACFDDQSYKGSHAGHICRVSFMPSRIRLGDDKEGVMRNDVFAIRKDPARKAEFKKMLTGRDFSAPVTIEQDKWHKASIEIAGDRMRVTLDGQPVGFLQSPGISHATKSSFHFAVTGPGVIFDEVNIWKAL